MEDTEQMIISRLKGIFNFGNVELSSLTLEPQQDGDGLEVRFTLTSSNATEPNTPLEVVTQRVREAQSELLRLRSNFETFFSNSTFSIDYQGMMFNSTPNSLSFDVANFVCPPGQRLHSNGLVCGE